MFSVFFIFKQKVNMSRVVVGWRRLHDAAVCKVNPRGHKKLLYLRRFLISVMLHTVYSGELDLITETFH